MPRKRSGTDSRRTRITKALHVGRSRLRKRCIDMRVKEQQYTKDGTLLVLCEVTNTDMKLFTDWTTGSLKVIL